MRILNVAAAQLGPIQKAESREAVVKRMLALLAEARAKHADLVVYPELALTTFFPRYYMQGQGEVDRWFEAEMPGPVAMACQTSSGVPGTSTSTWTERRPEASFFTLMMAPWDRISAAEGAPRPPGDARGRRGRIHRGTSKPVS